MSSADNDAVEAAADDAAVDDATVDEAAVEEPQAEEPQAEATGEVVEADVVAEPAATGAGGSQNPRDAGAGTTGTAAAAAAPASQPHVSPIELAHLEPGDHIGAVGNLELLRDIELSVTVEVGRARLRVRDLLALHEGSIVELDRPVGSPVDLLANGRAIARGEIVLVEDQLGIRVTAFNSDADGD